MRYQLVLHMEDSPGSQTISPTISHLLGSDGEKAGKEIFFKKKKNLYTLISCSTVTLKT